jgi:hypothetical protein
MRQLLEDYKRRLKTINEELTRAINEDDDISKIARLTTKRGCYRTFITELERLLPYTTSVEEPKEEVQKTYNEQLPDFLNKEPDLNDMPAFLRESEEETTEM